MQKVRRKKFRNELNSQNVKILNERRAQVKKNPLRLKSGKSVGQNENKT